MSWTGPNLSFWLITLMVVVSAAYAAFARSILKAAFALFFTLFGMAGYYVLLGSDFIAVTQVIIYVGGILVLLMFGVLLTNKTFPTVGSRSWKAHALVLVPAMLLLVLLGTVIFSAGWQKRAVLTEPQSSLEPLGHFLLGKYALALEIAGVTLLLCLVGAAYLVRRTEK